MNHDELLAKIDKSELIHFRKVGIFRFKSNAFNALRAVVELHKPEGIFCEFEAYEYPCPTIQAIEKELK